MTEGDCEAFFITCAPAGVTGFKLSELSVTLFVLGFLLGVFFGGGVFVCLFCCCCCLFVCLFLLWRGGGASQTQLFHRRWIVEYQGNSKQ